MDLQSRDAKARKIENLLSLRERDGPLKILEVGTGSGGIASYFGCHPTLRCEVDAVDVSDSRQSKEGFRFQQVNGVELPFPDAVYDVVISNHVIEHVGDHDAQRQHLAELHRVIKRDGIGYLAVPNRWQLVEPHYRLAFLSWLPERWRSAYVRYSGRGQDYDCRPLTVRVLEPMIAEAGFRCQQQLGRAVRSTFELERPGALSYRTILKHLPDESYRILRRVFPTLIYLLTPKVVQRGASPQHAQSIGLSNSLGSIWHDE
ncbi:class I SAM-dependent methyltransferase [Thioalkalivibrio sp. XN279]|uniref:class I SAM-dependent methyltransferase n=1 Tax=Thioalkalivibrio sp. XN279 TaxID=2714953 RepID=UPI00140E3DE7|nr:methyltransferase domain-containing protein [Thioalkalivibrio sp. XN279]